jgi:uncharacterized protein YcgL (UPF0745 family)
MSKAYVREFWLDVAQSYQHFCSSTFGFETETKNITYSYINRLTSLMYVVNQLKLQIFQPCSINLMTTKKQGLFVITSSDINFVKHAETKRGVHLLLPGTDRCFWVPLYQKLRLNERQITIKCEKDLATLLIPNANFDNFLNSFGTIINGTEFGYYKNDKKLSPDFKTGIQNRTRNAIIRLEQHLPFKSEISFCEERTATLK